MWGQRRVFIRKKPEPLAAEQVDEPHPQVRSRCFMCCCCRCGVERCFHIRNQQLPSSGILPQLGPTRRSSSLTLVFGRLKP